MSVQSEFPFLKFLNKFVDESEKIICNRLNSENKKRIINGFLKNLTNRLYNVSEHVLDTERNIYNEILIKNNLKKLSISDHAELIQLDQDYANNILNSYPELERCLLKITENFVINISYFIEHFISDQNEIFSFLNIDSKEFELHLELTDGETHLGQKIVSILTINNKKIIYKPRSFELEKLLYEQLEINSKSVGSEYALYIPRYIHKSNRVWMQYIEQSPIYNEDEAKVFYKQMGFILGFCSFYGITDITSDNLIAFGKNPVVIDLETGIYPTTNNDSLPYEIQWGSIDTNILPNWTWKGVDGIGVDLSALGGLKKQYVSLNLYQAKTDSEGNSEFVNDGVEIFPSKNVLYLNDEACKPWDHIESIKEGFSVFSENMLKHKFIEKFVLIAKGIECRYIPRPTATYHYANQTSYQSALMTNTKSRFEFLKKLLTIENASSSDFIEAEIQACLDCDVPYAKIKAGSLEIIEPHLNLKGALLKKEFRDGISNIRMYFENFNESRKNFELDVIDGCIKAMKSKYDGDLDINNNGRSMFNDISDEKVTHELINEQILNASLINKKFLKEYIEKGLKSNIWLGFNSSSDGKYEYSEIGSDFYHGLSGIYYAISKVNANVEFKELKPKLRKAALKSVTKNIENKGLKLGGYYFGISSSILPLIYENPSSSDSEAIIYSYLQLVDDCLNHEMPEIYFWGADLLNGSIGTLAVLSLIYKLTSIEECKKIAIKIKDFILNNQLCNYNGVDIIELPDSISNHESNLLTGLSHGASGCAYGLQIYIEIIEEDPKIKELVQNLLEWELNEFNSDQSNWKDYRKRNDKKFGEIGWSHGAPGIMLILNYFEDKYDIVRKFLNNNPDIFKVDKFLQSEQFFNSTLCHGSIGFLCILKKISPELLNDISLLRWSNIEYFSRLYSSQTRLSSTDAPSLMTGKSGEILGMEYLLEYRDNIPMLPHEMV